MKLPFRKNREFLSVLYDILGFYPHNIDIYRVAFSHKSLGYRRGEQSVSNSRDRKSGRRDSRNRKPQRNDAPTKPLNNERLEYLGDAVLETVVSDILFRHFEHKREGFLTATRSKIVQREALNRLASEMGLEKLIIAAQGTRMSHTNIGGNAFEALMGAIYLDRGYKHCHWFIQNRVIGRYVDLDNVAQKEVNFKSKLLEWSQKNRINIKFVDTETEEGGKGFSTVIVLEGITMSSGTGRSKKDSQQEASKEALMRMRKEPKTYDSIFRAKEKRTAMEAEESFALPKIDEIEQNAAKGNGRKQRNGKDGAPVLEDKNGKQSPRPTAVDEAYDTAYDESSEFEVIDTEPEQPRLTAADYEAKGLPAPPEEDELRAADEKLRKKRTRNRGPKTVGDAVKDVHKGETTPEERKAKREKESRAEVERQRAKAERKRKEAGEKLNDVVAALAAHAEPAANVQPAEPVAEPAEERPAVEVAPALSLDAIVFGTEHDAAPAPVEEAETEAAVAEAEESPEKPRRRKRSSGSRSRRPAKGDAPAENAEEGTSNETATLDAADAPDDAVAAPADTEEQPKPKRRRSSRRRRPSANKGDEATGENAESSASSPETSAPAPEAPAAPEAE